MLEKRFITVMLMPRRWLCDTVKRRLHKVPAAVPFRLHPRSSSNFRGTSVRLRATFSVQQFPGKYRA